MDDNHQFWLHFTHLCASLSFFWRLLFRPNFGSRVACRGKRYWSPDHRESKGGSFPLFDLNTRWQFPARDRFPGNYTGGRAEEEQRISRSCRWITFQIDKISMLQFCWTLSQISCEMHAEFGFFNDNLLYSTWVKFKLMILVPVGTADKWELIKWSEKRARCVGWP